MIWDRFADIAYSTADDNSIHDRERESRPADRDILSDTLSEPAGILAWTLLDVLAVRNPTPESTLGPQLMGRFDRAVGGPGDSGLLARFYLTRSLAYLDQIDPAWAASKLVPCLTWDHPDAVALWHARATDYVGSPRLFNALKPAMLEAFERPTLSENEYEGLTAQLLSVALWRRNPEASQYDLAPGEIKKALTIGPPTVRRNASRQLWIWMGEHEDMPANKGARWRTVIGPLFRDIWPLDARLRSEGSSRNLVLMALSSDAAFPEAVEAILDFVVPYQLYIIAHSLRLEEEHDRLVQAYPKVFLRLANALIDPATCPVPGDLGEFLQECARADATVVTEPSYVRLFGLRRQANA